MKAAAVTALSALLCGCAIDRQTATPAFSYSVPAPHQSVARCFIHALDGAVTVRKHHVAETDPGREYEVRPLTPISDDGDMYFVRLRPQGQTRTDVEVFVVNSPVWMADIKPAAEACRKV